MLQMLSGSKCKDHGACPCSDLCRIWLGRFKAQDFRTSKCAFTGKIDRYKSFCFNKFFSSFWYFGGSKEKIPLLTQRFLITLFQLFCFTVPFPGQMEIRT